MENQTGNQTAKRVIVVFKTHLDIGFTAMAKQVLAQYCESFIPAAVQLALRVNTPAQKRFVWMVGAYLPMLYLRTAPPRQAADFEEAARLGYIRWHALPCTTHTELMDEDLFTYGLSIGKKLDDRFGQTTIAAKMTDVPGHTKAMLPILARHGVEFLHLGVNASSRVPAVPALFRWRFGGSELVVNYSGLYGDSTLLPDGTALEFFHAQDNMGPPTEAMLEQEFARLQQKYPAARIEAGTLDDFALALRPFKGTLPVVEDEIGDTWIHGVGSDPLKASAFCRLLALKTGWLANGRLGRDTPEYEAFMEQMLLVTEHTWGMDVKKYLLDFTNWNKADFTRARKADTTSYALLAAGEAEQKLVSKLMDELITYRGKGNDTSSYRLFEASHHEQREYIANAIDALPAALEDEARNALTWQAPPMPKDAPATPAGEHFTTEGFAATLGGWAVRLGGHGQIIHLANPALGVDHETSLGLFAYDTFGAKTVQQCFESYGRDLDINRHWATYDFGKPGLEYETAIQDGRYYGRPVAVRQAANTLTVYLRADDTAATQYGCPRFITIQHRFEETGIHTTLYWQEKDAIRSPEALWLHMSPLPGADGWEIQKLGRWLNPRQVVADGARKLHCCQAARHPTTGTTLKAADSPLVSIGKPWVYNVDNQIESSAGGFWYNLYNNRWGTNFKQWFDEDMRFAFETTFGQR